LDYITHPDCLKHEMGSYHPECPDRLRALETRLREEGIWDKLTQVTAPLATDEDLLLAHPQVYIDRIRAAAPKTGQADLDPDTSMNPFTLAAALRAAGAATLAVERVMNGQSQRAFCAIRPPGHHAESARAMGFCLFNNVAIAARAALTRYGLKRVAILDFDVHHGNGTEEIFKDDDRVLLCSSFQHPFYPYSSLEQIGTNPHIVKTPLAARSDGSLFRQAVLEQWLPVVAKFQPELILVSAGFDAHADDQLASISWIDDDYAWISERIIELANAHSQGRVVSVLEGGYDLPALGRSAARHIGILAGE
jgi:acetoin utilization deacetylase AcuC-like enzyme